MPEDEKKENRAYIIFIIICLVLIAAFLFYVFFGPALSLAGWE